MERSGVHRVALSVSGDQLGATASVVAAVLDDRGVSAGTVIPVLMRRNPELVAVLMGIAGLGAGYAALDVRWPDERIRQICAMLDAPVVVTDQPSRVERAWCPAGLTDEGGAGGMRAVFASMPADAVCCVFFTSGSTGQPKGVLASYRGLSRLLRPGAMPLRLDASTVMSVAAPTPWDAFALELWGPLLNGGTCVLADGDSLTPAQIRRDVAGSGLNTVFLTSTLFSLFVEEDLGAFAGLGQVVVGGERLSPDHAGKFLRAHPDISLFNAYGPAENTIISTMHTVTLADCRLPTGIPIGRPVGGTMVYILDGERRCGPGELGELCLAGDRLSPGYLGDPEATRQAFVTIDVDGVPTRVYRSGDLGWRDEQGTYHFHGRADRQVKVRGHRIEPVEIEQHVQAHPKIARCVVVPTTDATGTVTGLMACYRADGAVSPTVLRDFLRARLPTYLVPERWLRMNQFPLLPNGKVDVGALTERATSVCGPPAVRVSCTGNGSDPLVAELRELVREVTRLDPVGHHDSLLDAGANSLQIVRLCIRTARRYGVDVEPAELFPRPTIGHLAELVQRSGPSHPTPANDYSLNAAQAAFLATEAVDPANRLAWHCTLLWRIDGPVDDAALCAAMRYVHHRHPALCARYPKAPPFWSARVEPATEPEWAVRACTTEQEAETWLDTVLNAPFQLDKGPAWRGALAAVAGRGRALLGVAVHHVAFDGWSEHVLARDLSAAYRATTAGGPERRQWFTDRLAWPTPPVADGDELDLPRRLLARELDGTPPWMLPGSARPQQDDRAGRLVRTLDEEQTIRYRALARAYGTTPFVLGLAGYAVAAHRLTGVVDFPVASPVVQRRPDNEDAVGCVLNLICVRLRLPQDTADPDAVIRATKGAVQRALRTVDVPFPEAVHLLRAAAGTGRPVMPNVFVFHQNPEPVLDLPGCRAVLSRPVPPRAGFEFQVDVRLPEHRCGEVTVVHRPVVDREFVEAFADTLVAFVTAGADCDPVSRTAGGWL